MGDDLGQFYNAGPAADLAGDFMGPPAEFAGTVDASGASGDSFRTATYTPGLYGAGSVDITPATNGGGGSIFKDFSEGLKAAADFGLGVYKDYTNLQLAGQQIQLAQQNQKLSYQVQTVRNDAAATVAKAQADTEKSVALAQASQAQNAAEIARRNALGQSVSVLPSQKMATWLGLAGLAVAVFTAFRKGK